MTRRRGVPVAAIVCLLLASPGAQSTKAIPAGSASLGGRVVDRESHQPIAGVVMTLTLGLDDGELKTLTDQNGEYTFEGVTAGRYRVSAALDGYVDEEPALKPVMEFEYEGGKGAIGQGTVSLGLRDGQARRGVDFALARAGSISGRIVDFEGKLLKDALVRATFMLPDGGFSLTQCERDSQRDAERRCRAGSRRLRQSALSPRYLRLRLDAPLTASFFNSETGLRIDLLRLPDSGSSSCHSSDDNEAPRRSAPRRVGGRPSPSQEDRPS